MQINSLHRSKCPLQNRHSYPSLILMGVSMTLLHACLLFILRLQEVKVSHGGGLGNGRTWLKLSKSPDHLSRLFHPDFALQTCRKLPESNFREKVWSHCLSTRKQALTQSSQPACQTMTQAALKHQMLGSVCFLGSMWLHQHLKTIALTFKDYCLNLSAIVLCNSVRFIRTIWMLAQKPVTQRYII